MSRHWKESGRFRYITVKEASFPRRKELRELLDELEKAPNPFDFEDLVFLTDNTWSEVADVFIMLMISSY